jgi:uncharacterized protein
MRPMLQPPPEKSRQTAGFWAALLIGWVVLGAAGVLYANFKGIPNWAAVPLLAAFLTEYPFYLLLGFPSLRERFAGPRLPLACLFIALAPYLLSCCGATRFEWIALLRLAALALTIGLWFRLPRHAVTDLLFLALYPAVLLGGYFDTIYIAAYAPLRRELIFLGHFTQIILTILALMVARRVPETGFGFLPTRREWRIGAAHYLLFAAIGLPLALVLHAIAWKHPAPLWSIAGTFLGFLWVASLSEEFLVRGVLQTWLEQWTGSITAALLIASVVFGLIHLGYGGRFPNWRWVLVATFLGWCCGHARNQAGGIRAGVVTHALAVATWRAFFS